MWFEPRAAMNEKWILCFIQFQFSLDRHPKTGHYSHLNISFIHNFYKPGADKWNDITFQKRIFSFVKTHNKFKNKMLRITFFFSLRIEQILVSQRKCIERCSKRQTKENHNSGLSSKGNWKTSGYVREQKAKEKVQMIKQWLFNGICLSFLFIWLLLLLLLLCALCVGCRMMHRHIHATHSV